MIRLRLTRVSSTDSRIVRVPSAGTPRPPQLVIEGILLRAVPCDSVAVDVAYAETYEEGIQYGELLALLLPEPGPAGRAQVFLTGEVQLLTSSASPEYVPLVIRTASSEYLIMVL